MPADPNTSEEHEGPTPNGGVRSIAHWLDDDWKPVSKDKATKCEIHELDAYGSSIYRTYAYLKPPSDPNQLF